MLLHAFGHDLFDATADLIQGDTFITCQSCAVWTVYVMSEVITFNVFYYH